MSNMIRCDKCHVMMFADSRSDKDAYCTVSIDYVDGHSVYHLCRVCHRQFLTEFMREYSPEGYDEVYGWTR